MSPQRLGVDRRSTRSAPSRVWSRAVDKVRRRWLVGRVTRALRMAWYWQRAGDLEEAGRDAGRASRLVQIHHGVPATLVADVALTMARIAQDRDDTVGWRKHLEHAAAVLHAAPGGADRDRLLGWALVGLGDHHRRAGDYAAAEQTLSRALRQIESTSPPDPLLQAAVLTSHGIAAKELGAFDTAARCYAHVSSIHREAGATRADAATLEHNLAGLQYARGRYAAAQVHARRALALRRQVPRVTEVDLAADLAVLGAALSASRRYEQARMLFQRALAAYQAARPPRRYEIAVQLHNLADLEHAAGRPAEAEDLYRQALSLKQDLLGPDHPEVGLVANNLGTLLSERGRAGEAAARYRQALAIADRAYGATHPLVARIRGHLGRLDTGVSDAVDAH